MCSGHEIRMQGSESGEYEGRIYGTGSGECVKAKLGLRMADGERYVGGLVDADRVRSVGKPG